MSNNSITILEGTGYIIVDFEGTSFTFSKEYFFYPEDEAFENENELLDEELAMISEDPKAMKKRLFDYVLASLAEEDLRR